MQHQPRGHKGRMVSTNSSPDYPTLHKKNSNLTLDMCESSNTLLRSKRDLINFYDTIQLSYIMSTQKLTVKTPKRVQTTEYS